MAFDFRMVSRRNVALALVSLACVVRFALASPRTTATQSVAAPDEKDRSDWWSFYNFSSSFNGLHPQDRLVDLESLTIGGVTLTEQTSGQIDSAFGKAVWLNRGEASGVRSQACYVSAGDRVPTYLIFEEGIESNTAFYLFRSARAWKGIDRCVRSSAVTGAVATVSGIHLGQDMDSVIALLGKPSQQTATELRYVLHQKIKLSDKQLAAFRSANPKMTDAELQKWAVATVEIVEYLTARVDHNGLCYFSVFVAIDG